MGGGRVGGVGAGDGEALGYLLTKLEFARRETNSQPEIAKY